MDWRILLCESCHVGCKTLSSILGLYPLDANRTIYPHQAVATENIFRFCQMSLGRNNHFQWRFISLIFFSQVNNTTSIYLLLQETFHVNLASSLAFTPYISQLRRDDSSPRQPSQYKPWLFLVSYSGPLTCLYLYSCPFNLLSPASVTFQKCKFDTIMALIIYSVVSQYMQWEEHKDIIHTVFYIHIHTYNAFIYTHSFTYFSL